jgi:hypothetical protein
LEAALPAPALPGGLHKRSGVEALAGFLTRMPADMVLTKEELIASLQNEVRILVHLADKVDKAKLD